MLSAVTFRPRSAPTLLVFLAGLLFCYGALAAYFYCQTRDFAIAEGKKQIENILLTHKAIQTYVEQVQRPEVYRLMETGKLYSDYFNPKLLSRTYIAREVVTFLNQERLQKGLPQVYFKLATTNPRNPINTADAREEALLQQMQAGELTEYSELAVAEGRYSLLYAIPISKSGASCLRCHGDPRSAPRELLELYGDTRAFHEEAGKIRALISVRIPLDRQMKEAREIFTRLSIGTGLLFLLVLGVIFFFVRRMEKQQNIILEKNLELQRLATVDLLTGVYNRQGFVAILEKELKIANRYNRELSLILLDLDFFKKINDTQGHIAGDEVLAEFGKRLLGMSRAADIVARWGGEEFVIACPHTGLRGAMDLADKMRLQLASHTFPFGSRLTASFGIAQHQTHESLALLVERADKALYRAKETGRNRVCAEGQTDQIQS